MAVAFATIGANSDAGLYTVTYDHVHAHGGTACLGFEVVAERSRRMAAELDMAYVDHEPGLAAFDQYTGLIDAAAARHIADRSWRSRVELTPQLIGLEGKRVEVVDRWNQRRRFHVGKSTGWIPCHLELTRRSSSDGGAVTGAPFKSVRVIR